MRDQKKSEIECGRLFHFLSHEHFSENGVDGEGFFELNSKRHGNGDFLSFFSIEMDFLTRLN